MKHQYILCCLLLSPFPIHAAALSAADEPGIALATVLAEDSAEHAERWQEIIGDIFEIISEAREDIQSIVDDRKKVATFFNNNRHFGEHAYLLGTGYTGMLKWPRKWSPEEIGYFHNIFSWL